MRAGGYAYVHVYTSEGSNCGNSGTMQKEFSFEKRQKFSWKLSRHSCGGLSQRRDIRHYSRSISVRQAMRWAILVLIREQQRKKISFPDTRSNKDPASGQTEQTGVFGEMKLTCKAGSLMQRSRGLPQASKRPLENLFRPNACRLLSFRAKVQLVAAGGWFLAPGPLTTLRGCSSKPISNLLTLCLSSEFRRSRRKREAPGAITLTFRESKRAASRLHQIIRVMSSNGATRGRP